MSHRTRRALSAAGAVALAAVATLVLVPPAGAGTSHDVGVTVDDGQTEVVAGSSSTYTITATNAGPSGTSGGLVVSSTFTPGVWTCVGAGGGTCPASGSGAISGVTVSLPGAGASVTFTVPVDVPSSATDGSTASVQATLSTIGDTDEANDTAIDDDTVAREADLSITKTDAATERSPGEVVPYVIDVTNPGPSDTTATVADTFPAVLTGTAWSCITVTGAPTCTVSGSGDIDDDVTLPAGSSVRYTASGVLAQGTTGSLANTATVTASGGTTDDNPANDAATDTDTVVPRSDLAVTITDGVGAVSPGDELTYTVGVTNGGPADTTGTLSVPPPADVADWSWTCSATGGGACSASGTGAVDDAVTVPVGAQLTYTITGTLALDADGTVVASASVANDSTESDPPDNAATDTDTIADLLADLSVAKDGPDFVLAGDTITYELTVANSGPDSALDVLLTDELPAGTTFVSLTTDAGVAFDTATTPAVGANGTVTVTWDQLDDGDSAVLLLTVDTTEGLAPGTEIANTATVETFDDDQAPVTAEATVDPDGTDDADTAVTVVVAEADLVLTKSLVGSLVQGTNATYTLTVKNNGPDATFGSIVAVDALPAGMTFVSATGTGWVCEHDDAESAVVCVRDASLANGASSTISVVVRITAAAGTRLVNEAGVLSESFDADPTDNFAQASATVAATTTITTAGGLPRTGGPVDVLVRMALVAFGVGLIAFSTGSLNLLRQLPVRRRP